MMSLGKTGRWRAGIACLAPLIFASGCGWIADKDRIVVATLDGEPIRRGDLKRIIREMSDEERPLVQNKGDLLRTLNKYIDETIKAGLAKRLKGENRIAVPREMARESYFQNNPEDRSLFEIQDPKALNLTEAGLKAVQAAVEFKIDDEEERLFREQAVMYRVQEALKGGLLAIADEEFRQEYSFQKRTLRNFEQIEFIGIRFPTTLQDAASQAAAARRRMDLGESFDQVAQSYARRDPSRILRSGFENNPASDKFRTFWSQVSGCKAGDILGPVYLPYHELVRPAEDGTSEVIPMPGAHFVFQVIEHRPESEKTLEEAKPELAPPILYRKMVERLRTEHGVEIYEDKLPDPAGYGDQFKDSFIRTG